MKRKKIYGIFMLVAIAVFLFAGGRILQIYLNYQESQKVYEQMKEFSHDLQVSGPRLRHTGDKGKRKIN